MGADSVSRGAWLLPPFVGRHAKAAVDDYWARPLRCANGLRSITLSIAACFVLGANGSHRPSAQMPCCKDAPDFCLHDRDKRRRRSMGNAARSRRPFPQAHRHCPRRCAAEEAIRIPGSSPGSTSTSSGCSTIASMTGVPNPYALTTSSARIVSSPFCA